MTSTSSDPVVLRGLPAEAVQVRADHADLRAGTGAWTRLGSGAALGDPVTEEILGGLAEQAHRAARAQGYAQGWAEGRRVALARAAQEAAETRRAAELERARQQEEHRHALAALEAATTQVHARLAEAVEELGGHAVEVALQLTEAILGREVATCEDPGADALRRAMTLVGPDDDVTVRLHPADHARLDSAVLEGRRVHLVGDPTLARGDVVVETDRTVVDATVGAALDRVREVLAG